MRLVTAGDQTVTVSAPNMTSASATVTVTGQVTRLGFTVPSNVVAGDTFNVTITAQEANGNTAVGYTSQIRFTSTDGLAGLPTDYTFTAADAGSHTFTITLKTSGAQFVSAKEVGGSIGGGATVSVSPQAATSLTLAGGTGAIGVARPITVAARDAFGALVGTQAESSSPPRQRPHRLTSPSAIAARFASTAPTRKQARPTIRSAVRTTES